MSKTNTSKTSNPFFNFLKKHPYLCFFVSLAVLGLLIGASYLWRKPVIEELPEADQPLAVEVAAGDIYYLAAQAQIQKDNVVTIVAQTSGVVQQLNFQPGDTIKKGQSLLNLSTNYQGGNAAAIQAAQAQVSYRTNQETYDLQKEVLNHNREIAEIGFTSAQKQRDWNAESIDQIKGSINETKAALDHAQKIIDGLEVAVGSNPALHADLMQMKSTKAQLLSGLSQSESGLKSLEYSLDEDEAIYHQAEIQRDLNLKNIEIQEKTLAAQLEATRLTAALANVQASLMTPSVPFAGTVQKINVKKGDLVNPGQTLAVIAATDTERTAILNVSLDGEVAKNYASDQPAKITLSNGEKVWLRPTFISEVPTTGAAYNLYFEIDPIWANQIENQSYLSVEIPFNSLTEEKRLVPIDSIYQTQFENYAYVVATDDSGSMSASRREVELGRVTGNLVTIESGLTADDLVILNRQVKNGQAVEIINQPEFDQSITQLGQLN